jgi:type IV pilus assembly protein PilB
VATRDVGTLLVQQNLVTQEQFREARDVQMQRGGDVGRICVDMGFLDDRRLAGLYAQVLSLSKVDLGKVSPDPAAIDKIPSRLAQNLCAFPYALKDSGRTLWIAMANPFDESGREALRRAAGCALKITVAGYREIERALQSHLADDAGGDDAGGLDLDGADEEVKITDVSGRTLVTMAPKAPARSPPPVPEPAPAPPREPNAPFGEDERRMVVMLQEGLSKSGGALQAVLEPCVERGLFTREQLAAKLRGK